MSKLKSAYELASERIIFSKNKRPEDLKSSSESEDNSNFDALDGMIPIDIEYEEKEAEELEESEEDVEFVDGEKDTVNFIEEIKKMERKMQNVEEPKKETEEEYYGETRAFPDKLPELHWHGNFTTYSGFSRMNRAMVIGLSGKGVVVKTDIEEAKVEINEATVKEIERMSYNQISNTAPKIFGATVPITPHHGGYRVAYTMMESSETLHERYVEKLNSFNEIWVPTHYGVKLFKENGVKPPVSYMPLGIDLGRYHPDQQRMDFNIDLNNFVFISVFKWGYRKGYDILIKSFLEEFSSEEDVSLLIVSRNEQSFMKNRIQNDFAEIMNSVKKPQDQMPHIALYDKVIKEKDMPKIYKSADAFVLISRGEGFGYPYCEAAACELPVIGSFCSGQSDYLNEENSFLVYPEKFEKAIIGKQFNELAKTCGFYENQKFPVFANEAIEQTRGHMRYVFENYEDAKNKAVKLRKKIYNEYDSEKVINKVYDRVMELQE